MEESRSANEFISGPYITIPTILGYRSLSGCRSYPRLRSKRCGAEKLSASNNACYKIPSL